MEKLIARWGFMAGLVCGGIALLWRVANLLGFFVSSLMPAITVHYTSFYKAAVLFLMLSIAASLSVNAAKSA